MPSGIYKRTEEQKKKMSETHKKIGTGKWMKGRKLSEETKQKISKANKGNMPKFIPLIKGENHHAWKGGVTPIYKAIRKSAEYKLWRNAVFMRDNYTCIWCGTKDKTIKADHIKRFAQYKELFMNNLCYNVSI